MGKNKFEPKVVNKPVEVVNKVVNKFRYFCEACTGIAMVAEIPEVVKTVKCAVCGKEQTAKKENWIKI